MLEEETPQKCQVDRNCSHRKQVPLKPPNFHGQFVILSHVYRHRHPPLMCAVVWLCLSIGVILCSIFSHYIGIQLCLTPDINYMMMTGPITLNDAMKPQWNNYAIINFCSVKEHCFIWAIFLQEQICVKSSERRRIRVDDAQTSAMNYELRTIQM